MANVSVTTTWSDAQVLYATPLNGNFADLVNYINARNGGSTAWDALSVTGASTLTGAVSCGAALSVAGALTTTGGPSTFTGYRRPNLTFTSVTAVDVENNTGTANQTTIIFTDGSIRSVTEDTSSTHKYRRFIITATAEFTSGTEDSGLRSGLSETTNTWYAIYAVKSAINSANFVLVGDTTLPLQANFSTLNGRYGTNGWVYLGVIRNGDNSGATGDILAFKQSGSQIAFTNSTASFAGVVGVGLLLGSSSATTSALVYSYSAGTGTTELPNQIQIIALLAGTGTGSSETHFRDSATTQTVSYIGYPSAGGITALRFASYPASKGLAVQSGESVDRFIYLVDFHDPLLDGTFSTL